MKRKRFWLIRPVSILLAVLCLVLCGLLALFSLPLFLAVLPFVLAAVSYSVYRLWRLQKDLYRTVTSMGRSMTDSHDASLINFPLPAVIVNDIDEIIWYNEMFRETVLRNQKDVFGCELEGVLKTDIQTLLANQGTVLSYNNLSYQCFCLKTTSHGLPLYLLYLVDITELEETRQQFLRTRP